MYSVSAAFASTTGTTAGYCNLKACVIPMYLPNSSVKHGNCKALSGFDLGGAFLQTVSLDASQ